MIGSKEKFRIFQDNYELITDNINELIIIINQEFEIKYINNIPLIKALGYNDNDLIGNSWLNYVHSEDLEIAINLLKKCTSSKINTQELRLQHRKGYFKTFEFYCKKNEKSTESNEILIVLKDITEKLKSEYLLRESEDKFRSITEQSLMGIFILQKGKFKYINQTVGNINGYTVEEMLSWTEKEIVKTIYPQDREKIMNKLKRSQDGDLDQHSHSIFRIINKNGELKWIEEYNKKINFQGEPASLVTIIDITDKIESELKLKESEEKFRTITEQSLMGIIILQDNQIKYVNSAAADMVGYTVDEILNILNGEFINFIHPDDRRIVLEQAKKRQKGIKTDITGYEHRCIKKNGEIIWIQNYSKTIKYEGKFADLITVIDISDRKMAELKLKKSEQELIRKNLEINTIFNTIPAMLNVVDKEYNVINISNAFAKAFLNGKKESAFGRKCYQVHKQRDNVCPECSVKRVFNSGNIETRFSIPEEESRTGKALKIYSAPIKDVNGNITGAVEAIMDITDIMKAEEKIRESEKRLKDLIETVPVGISITTPKGKVVECNSNIYQIFGYESKEEFLEIPARDFYYNPSEREKFIKLLERGIVNDFEAQFKRKEGSTFWGSLNSTTQEMEGQTFIINSFQDITERKIAEIKIQQSEAELAAIYDFTPISIILLDSERRVRKINKFALEMTGRQEEEVIGIYGGEALRCLYSIKDPRGCGFSSYCDQCIIRNTVLDTFKTKTPYTNVEATLDLLPDSGVDKVHFLFSTVPLNFNGENRVLVGLIDITERVKAKKELKDSEEKFRMITEQSLMGIALIQDGKIKYASERLADIYGYSVEEVLSWEPNEFLKTIAPESLEFVKEQAKKKQLGDKDVITHYLHKIIKKTGEKRWVENYSKTINYKGKPADLVTNIDITELKETELKLKESEVNYKALSNELETILDLIPGLIFCKDKNDIVTRVNQRFANILNLKKEDIIGKTTFDLFPKDQAEAFRKDDLEVINTGKPKLNIEEEVDFPIIKIWSSTSKVPYYKDKGELNGIIGLAIDISERKRFEKELKDSEERFKFLVSSSPAVIYTSKTSGDYGATFVSENVKEKWGYNPKSFVNNSEFWINHVHPEDKEKVLTIISSIFEKENITYEYRFELNDGTFHWMRDEVALLRDENGIPVEMIGYVIDITKRVETEQELKRSEENYRNISHEYKMILESITDAVYAMNKDWEYILVNKNAEKIVNMSIDNLLGHTIYEVFPGIKNTPFFKTYETVMMSRKAERVIEFFSHPDGRTGYYEVSVYPIKEGILCIAKDVTEEKEFEEKIKESEEKFRTIAEESSLGMIIQQDGYIKFANSAVSEIIEYPMEEIHKWTVENSFKFVYKEDLPLIVEKLKQRQDGDYKTINKYECRVITKLGKIKWIEVYTKPIIYQGKNAVLSTFIDISEKKDVEEKLKEINRLKSELISRTSHELKTPLVAIKGYADLLLNVHYENLDFHTISIIHEIKQGCRRLETLIKDLLETSKLESEEIELNKIEEDLSFLVQFCVSDMKGLAETRNHVIFLDIQDHMITKFEKEKIYEVIVNLISNAIKYTPPNGKINITSKEEGGFYIISVQDNGIGLTNDEKSQIFKKFGKVERYGQGLDVVSEGTGLGLYISKKIIELHKGTIWVESEGRNKGSRFNFSLPIIKE